MKNLHLPVYAAAARTLTLARLAGIPFFLWLLLEAPLQGPHPRAGSLLALYLFIALSDLADGPLARRGGAESPGWGGLDALADIAFNALSLSVAAWPFREGP